MNWIMFTILLFSTFVVLNYLGLGKAIRGMLVTFFCYFAVFIFVVVTFVNAFKRARRESLA